MSEQETETIRHRARGFFRREEQGISPSLETKLKQANGSSKPVNVLILMSRDKEKEVGFMLDEWRVDYTYFKENDYVASLPAERIKELSEIDGVRLFDFPYTPKKVAEYHSLHK